MNLRVAVRFVRPFAKVAPMITNSPASILRLVCTLGAVAAVALAGIALAPTPASAAPPAIYNFTPDGVRSFGNAVNDAGQVAGTFAARAFRYDFTPGGGGVMYDLTQGAFDESSGYGINNAGQVAGEGFSYSGGIYFAFRYIGTPGIDGVRHDLGSLNAFGGGAIAYGINNAGQVTGRTNITGSTFPPAFHAFLYDGIPGADGRMHDLGTLGGTSSYGRSINAAGQVSGYSQITGNTAEHAFRYDGMPGSGGVMRDLGTLGGSNSYGSGINDAGQVVGNSQLTGDTARHAFLFTGTPGAGGVMHDLGTLGGTGSGASAVNDAGQVVGASQITGDTASHAFLYTGTPGAGGQMIDLDDWLDANIPTEGAKWTLAGEGGGASDISNTGWITGTGVYDPDGPGGTAADFRAYLLDASSLLLPDLPGDFNFDGMVNAADYTVWRDGLGTTYSQDDYDDWRAHFGQSLGAGSGAAPAVPEPATCLLGVLALGWCLTRRQRR